MFIKNKVVIKVDIKKLVGNNIKYYRFLHGYTQQELSEKTNISIITISNIENGYVDVKIQTLEKLANSLGVEIPELFNKTERKSLTWRVDLQDK